LVQNGIEFGKALHKILPADRCAACPHSS
jgi:hypothetical protein